MIENYIQEYNIVGMISHLGPQLSLASGVGLASKIRNEKKATIVFTGDGGASEGDFHEALNVASVWDLPVIFAVENNCWGLSTPSSEQFKCEHFILANLLQICSRLDRCVYPNRSYVTVLLLHLEFHYLFCDHSL